MPTPSQTARTPPHSNPSPRAPARDHRRARRQRARARRAQLDPAVRHRRLGHQHLRRHGRRPGRDDRRAVGPHAAARRPLTWRRRSSRPAASSGLPVELAKGNSIGNPRLAVDATGTVTAVVDPGHGRRPGRARGAPPGRRAVLGTADDLRPGRDVRPGRGRGRGQHGAHHVATGGPHPRRGRDRQRRLRDAEPGVACPARRATTPSPRSRRAARRSSPGAAMTPAASRSAPRPASRASRSRRSPTCSRPRRRRASRSASTS